MTLIVNGNTITLKENGTILDLIRELKIEGKVMAAAVNMTIVKQEAWETHRLNDGDKVELLDFVGGG